MKYLSLALALAGFLIPAGSSFIHAAEWKPTTLPARRADAAGPVWYRCYIRVPQKMVDPNARDASIGTITLNLADIRGPFEVYLNGTKIAQASEVLDGPRQRFKVPKGILKKDAFNALAIRLDAKAAITGIGQSPILAEENDEALLDGAWESIGGQPNETELKPVSRQPATAFYLESAFRPATSLLGRNQELMPGVRIAPKDSLAMIKTRDDLVVDLIASEPAVAQPTQITFDERGRMWVAQYRQYPYPAGLKMITRDMYYRARFDKVPPPPPHQDKGADIITVHEDSHGDGIFDKHKIVLDGLNMANSALYGHGGIWVMNSPYLMFYPDSKGTDIPERDPEVRLAGFGLEDTHSVANGLTWGPDGWLYGAQGSTVTSRVTRPGIDPPNSPGVYYEGHMVWRYHPEKKIYEIFATGGGNTFGVDFDAEGRLYSGFNGGRTHGFHYIQGGLYVDGVENGKYGPSADPYSFGNLKPMKSRNPIPRFTHNILKFEGNALPSQYVGRLLGADPLHRCMTASELYPIGSTFETSDDEKPLTSSDITFRPVYLVNAPDGSLFIADFCEEFIGHSQNYQGQIDPTSGRIYRLRGKGMPLNKDVNLSIKTTAELIETLHHPNRWHRHTAVRLLGQHRDAAAIAPLKALLKNENAHPAVEALWALSQMGAFDEATAISLLDHPAAAVRMWAVRLMGDYHELPANFATALAAHIPSETDPEVRCQIAATARRLSAGQAMPIVASLLKRDADVLDPAIPLLCWWTIESHCDSDREAVLNLLKEPVAWNSVPMKQEILPRLMRRFAVKGVRADFLACARLFVLAPADEYRKQLMAGFEEAFNGRALPPLPQELAAALAKSGNASPLLRVRLGDAQAIDTALKIAADPKARYVDRLSSTTLFGEVKTPQAVPVLIAIAQADNKTELRKAAIGSLLLYDDDAIGTQVAGLYESLPPEIRSSAINLLASRASWSMALLKLIENGTVKPADVPADVATRLRSQSDTHAANLAVRLLPIRKAPPKTERMAEIARVRRIIDAGPGDAYKGEATFMQRCATCHTLFFKGGKVGPNLTSYQREDLGTMLISIIDPSAEIREGYQNFILRTKDGRIISGFLADNDTEVVSLRGIDGQDVRVARKDIDVLKALPQSIMPEGLLDGLSDQQLRDFFTFLRISQPISK